MKKEEAQTHNRNNEDVQITLILMRWEETLLEQEAMSEEWTLACSCCLSLCCQHDPAHLSSSAHTFMWLSC